MGISAREAMERLHPTRRPLEKRRTFLIGGTRGTGLLVAQLLSDGGSRVSVLARNVGRAAKRIGTDRINLVARTVGFNGRVVYMTANGVATTTRGGDAKGSK